jgi:hypothetical protein
MAMPIDIILTSLPRSIAQLIALKLVQVMCTLPIDSKNNVLESGSQISGKKLYAGICFATSMFTVTNTWCNDCNVYLKTPNSWIWPSAWPYKKPFPLLRVPYTPPCCYTCIKKRISLISFGKALRTYIVSPHNLLWNFEWKIHPVNKFFLCPKVYVKNLEKIYTTHAKSLLRTYKPTTVSTPFIQTIENLQLPYPPIFELVSINSMKSVISINNSALRRVPWRMDYKDEAYAAVRYIDSCLPKTVENTHYMTQYLLSQFYKV